MGKGSWRRPNGPGFDDNFCNNFPDSRGCERERVIREALDLADEQKRERQERADQHTARNAERAKRLIALSLDELRSIVFETSAAYAAGYIKAAKGRVGSAVSQQAEWDRAAALKNALTHLGYDRESEMIGGAA